VSESPVVPPRNAGGSPNMIAISVRDSCWFATNSRSAIGSEIPFAFIPSSSTAAPVVE
jgi:hypothetical protein